MKKLIFNYKLWIGLFTLATLYIFYQFSQNGRYKVERVEIGNKEINLVIDTQTGSLYELESGDHILDLKKSN